MNCVCGHSVFDHAKASYGRYIEPWMSSLTFTLSGPCEALQKGESYRACGCTRFARPAKYAEALRDLQETPMRFLTLAEEAQDELMAIGAGLRGIVESGGMLHGYNPGTVQPITLNPTGAAAIDRGLDAREWREWWKKYDRAPEPGPSEVM